MSVAGGLNRSNSYSIDRFAAKRRSAMVALMVAYPAVVGRFLAVQFYERNYSLAHRLDVLDVIAEGIRTLGDVVPQTPEGLAQNSATMSRHPQAAASNKQNASPHRAAFTLNTQTARQQAAAVVIQKRLEAKTRRFGLVRSSDRAPRASQANTFASFVGECFYPLIGGLDRPCEHLDLMHRDALLLATLLRTLGVVVMATGASPVSIIGHTGAVSGPHRFLLVLAVLHVSVSSRHALHVARCP